MSNATTAPNGAPSAASMAAPALQAEARLAEQVIETQRQFSEMTLALANEVMGFAARRMQAQADFMTQLSRCGDAADMLDVQLRFVAATTSDYASEMTTLAKVMQPSHPA